MKTKESRNNAEETAGENLFNHSIMIKEEARRLGFNGCGISRAQALPEEAIHLQTWLNCHYQASMAYMENHAEKRIDPAKLVLGAESIISVILNYYPAQTQTDPEAPVLSKYAYGKDYHEVIRKKLKRLLQYISSNIAPVCGRAFVDSAPVLEKAWAARAGLGWIGKNTCLISPKTGSFCFIGSLIVDIPLHYDQPIADFCGHCTCCIDACPTQAIVAPRMLDAGRCISYLTIENKSPISEEFKNRLANRLFGCDICQDVCPWNKKIASNREKDFEPLPELLEMTREDWFNLDEEQYNRIFKNSAVKRVKFAGLKRNIDFIAKESVNRKRKEGKNMTELDQYLQPTDTIDCASDAILAKAREVTTGCTSPVDKALALFSFVRDDISYNLYMISVFREDFTASRILAWGKGYCVQKAVLFAALARAVGIPSRLAFAKILNHKVPEKIVKLTGDNIFPRHGYTQLFLENTWINVAPTFDKALCEKIGVPVVEWDGRTDATLPPADLQGRPYIEYVEKFGAYADLPFDWIVEAISKKVGKDKRPWLSRQDIPTGR
ncbi:MAG: tRNA epoxyqueuosine(34) reductase QueG [Syntrophaceae bacterium]|nr:tRNA epoxyqueuosine(34) reductase QueG [Syntrophaceae bacterium]